MSKILGYIDNILNHDKKTLEYTQNYWKTRILNNPENSPANYIDDRPSLKERSLFLLGLIEKYSTKNDAILEIGCNAGRNLNYLYNAGYRNLSGLDINPQALETMRKVYPEMAENINLIEGPIEDHVEHINDERYSTIYTMAVLQHIHYDSDWIFPEIARICGNCLIIIESEANDSWRHYPRNYKHIFEEFGMKQVYSDSPIGLGKGFKAEIFTKKDT